MRTTLAIDDDVLAAVRTLASQQRRSLGEVVSDLARRGLFRERTLLERNGFPLLQVRGEQVVVGLELVNRSRDENE